MDFSELTWRKSSYSGAGGNGACVEIAWRKSSYSGSGGNANCVEVAYLSPAAAVRDSKSPDSGILTFPTAPWAAFLDSQR
jgi:hypothetical protein